MIGIPPLHNATVFESDFLLAMMSVDAASPTVCRINRAVNHEELIVTCGYLWQTCQVGRIFKYRHLFQLKVTVIP